VAGLLRRYIIQGISRTWGPDIHLSNQNRPGVTCSSDERPCCR